MFCINNLNANDKNSPANKNDLDLYHGMGVSFLCNATRKGFDLDFPKTLNVASATFASVVSQKHGGKIIEKKKYDRSQEREITSYSIGREICQCATETFIENSRNPGKMRSIMMICFLIDMLMRRKKYSAGKSGQKIYAKFNNTFRYPIIVAHGMGDEFLSPSWFVCGFFGIDKKVDWGI